MTDTTTTTTTGANDIQDPLPESNWLWRRVFCFAVTAVLLSFVWVDVDQIGRIAIVAPRIGTKSLLTITQWIIATNALLMTYYLLAPSAEQMLKALHTVSLLKSGVQIASRRIETGPEHRVDESATIARPPQPAIPGAGPAPAPHPTGPHFDMSDIAGSVESVRDGIGSYFNKGDHQ